MINFSVKLRNEQGTENGLMAPRYNGNISTTAKKMFQLFEAELNYLNVYIYDLRCFIILSM